MVGFLVIFGSLLGAAVKLGGYVASPIKEQLSYMCCYRRHKKSLEDEVNKLKIRRESVQQAVDSAARNVEVISPDVVDWLRRVDEIKVKSDTLYEASVKVQKGCLGEWCPFVHYSLSRESKRTAKVSFKLQNNSTFERISQPRWPGELDTIPDGLEIELKSRYLAEVEIMDALKDDEVRVIGLCGMGGVGKTTMIKKIERRARQERLFEAVVMLIVTQKADQKMIQCQIAEHLGLKLVEETMSVRARRLHTRLMDVNSILIIMDDVWKRLDLEELGIPSPGNHKGIKVILISRVRNVCEEMNATKILSLEILPEQEAWTLFSEKAGKSIHVDGLLEIAADVAKECKGLPIALVTIGSALRNRTIASWEDALQQLKRSNIARNIPEWLDNVYLPLKFSYDQLRSEEVRYLFLLCSLFREDDCISIETLVRYGVTLGIFSGVETLVEARNRVHLIVEMLKSRFLLINGEDSESVKMHDVIRDMAISIASENKHVFLVAHDEELKAWPKSNSSSEDYTCISLRVNRLHNFPARLNCPKLEVLCMEFSGQRREIPVDFFHGMRMVKVLDISCIQSLPSSLHLLTNLRALLVRTCSNLRTLTVVGELIKLEILSIINTDIEVLPKEIGGLKNLKILEIIRCGNLKNIAPGVISGLLQLEELVMLESFQSWEAEEEGKERSNASLAEVASLNNLTNLQIHIPNPNIIPEELPQWQKLTRYNVVIGNVSNKEDSCIDKYPENFRKVISFSFDTVAPLGESIYGMLRNADCLVSRAEICNDVLDKLDQEGFHNVKALHLYSCKNVKRITDATRPDMLKRVIFPLLESLCLQQIDNLKDICLGTPSAGSFGALKQIIIQDLVALTSLWKCPSENLCLRNLKRVCISRCRSLEYVFPLSTAKSLVHLEELKVKNCPIMKEVFKGEREENMAARNSIKLCKLGKLSLKGLPNLNSFSSAADGIEFSSLHTFKMKVLPNLTDVYRQFLFNHEFISTSLKNLFLYNLGSATGIQSLVKLNTATSSLKNQIGNFSGLEILDIRSCHSLRYLFSSSMSRALVNLRKLKIMDCSMLQEVIEDDEKDEQDQTLETLFPQLRQLVLLQLPNVQRFCHIKNVLEFPSLEQVIIEDCPMMETFSLRPLCVPTVSKTQIAYSSLGIQVFFGKEVTENLSLCALHTAAGKVNHGIPLSNLGRLEILEVVSCNGIRSLFSHSMLGSLKNLKELRVINCLALQEVISEEDKEGQTIMIKESQLPQLRILILSQLPQIQRFSGINNLLELPLIEEVTIYECPMMKIFSLGFLNMSSRIRVFGLLDVNLATQLFFNRQNSDNEILMNRNCFFLSARDMSIALVEDNRFWNWCFVRDSSDKFVVAAKLLNVCGLKINGTFETTKLEPGLVYEILLSIMLDENAYGWDDAVNLKLILPNEVPRDRFENIKHKPRGKWIEVLVGEFLMSTNLRGDLEFYFSQQSCIRKKGLLIKGVTIRPKAVES